MRGLAPHFVFWTEKGARRLHLKKLEMQGFKSFADKIELVFDAGITGIVGPNGSGKSNIGDAVRWVLGEQNARQLRGSRMEDIIFGGTQLRKPLSFCEVRLTFDNEDGALPIDFSEISIMRRVYRSGESEYYINRNSCRLKDIIDLFRDTGVGKQGYSIISQGQIDEILSARPEDRREVFHEAVGIMKYRARRDEAERRLENTRRNLQRLCDIMDEMELQLEPLRVQSENARQFLALSERLRDLDINRFLRLSESLGVRTAQLQERAQELAEAHKAGERERIRIEEALGAHRAALAASDEEVSRLQQQVMDIQEQLSRRRSRRDVLTERLERMQSENERISAEAQRDRQRAGELRHEARQLREDAGAQDTLTQRRQQVERQEARLDDLDESIGRMEAELERQKAQILEAMGHMASRKSSQARLITLRESLEKRCREIGDQIAAVDRDTHNSLAVEEEIASRMSGITAQRDTAAAELAQRQERAKAVAQRLEQLARDVENTRQQLQAARTRMSMLLSMKRDYEGYGQSVRKLMADTRSDTGIEGRIVGLVAELIEVPRRYLTAVETALGPAMQYIVTNTEEDAKALIAHLRRNQYGRATFLPLSAIRSRSLSPQERAALQQPGCHGVAAELVTAEPHLREIIGNLLGRTLIAENMDAAIAIARSCGHSLRIVTLEGDVIHSGGSMTGGSIHSKFTSILGRELELEETQSKGKALSERLRQLTGELEAARQAAQREQQDHQSLAGEIHEADVALAREQERHQRARQNRERLAGERDKLTAELEQLRQNLADIAGQMEREQRSDDRSEQDETALREQAAARQRQINALREKRDEEMERLTALRVALAADERDRDARLAQAARLEQEAAHLEATAAQRLQAFQDNIRSIEEEKAALSDAGNEAGEEQAALAHAQDALKAAREERQALQTRIAGLEDGLSRVRVRLEELTGQRHELEVALTRTAADLEMLHSRIWENYELTAESAQEFRREDFDIDRAEKEAAAIRREIRKLGTVNVAAVEDYANLKARFDEYAAQRRDLEKGEADLMTVISDLNRQMENRFRHQFAKLNEYFGETFVELFGGGKATLVLEDESDILSSGIEIKAQPVGKNLQLLSLFSGGEKALIAIALLFAMLKLRPSPFCVLDEIESALDEANLKRFAQYLRQYAKKMQFIVVTHRKPTMEAADRLYGITMEEKGVSRMIAMKISDYTGDIDDGKAGPFGAAQDGTDENKGRPGRAHR